MAIEITIPRLGWSMDEGTFGEWLKQDGEFVASGDPVFTLESEKALQEVESVDEGFLSILPDGPQEGDTVAVGTPVAYLLTRDEEPPSSPVERTAPNIVEKVAGRSAAAATETEAAAAETVQTARAARGSAPRRNVVGTPAISPRAARLATQLGINWTALIGSGSTGRIRECDVRAAAGGAAHAATNMVRPPAAGGTRRTIAERMLQTVRNAALVTLTHSADATNLVALREQFKAGGRSSVPAYHDLVAKLVAGVLLQHPTLNSQWTDAGIVQPAGIHIGLAVDTAAGLLVPVVRHAERLSLFELTHESQRLLERARQRKCSVDELQGGTFSITNLGAFGIEYFTPIPNPPQTAILGLGAIRREAVVTADDQIVPQNRLPLSLTFDHRVTDGAPAARFLQAVVESIENPAPALLNA